jgi:hypothetical protein
MYALFPSFKRENLRKNTAERLRLMRYGKQEPSVISDERTPFSEHVDTSEADSYTKNHLGKHEMCTKKQLFF